MALHNIKDHVILTKTYGVMGNTILGLIGTVL